MVSDAYVDVHVLVYVWKLEIDIVFIYFIIYV